MLTHVEMKFNTRKNMPYPARVTMKTATSLLSTGITKATAKLHNSFGRPR